MKLKALAWFISSVIAFVIIYLMPFASYRILIAGFASGALVTRAFKRLKYSLPTSLASVTIGFLIIVALTSDVFLALAFISKAPLPSLLALILPALAAISGCLTTSA